MAIIDKFFLTPKEIEGLGECFENIHGICIPKNLKSRVTLWDGVPYALYRNYPRDAREEKLTSVYDVLNDPHWPVGSPCTSWTNLSISLFIPKISLSQEGWPQRVRLFVKHQAQEHAIFLGNSYWLTYNGL